MASKPTDNNLAWSESGPVVEPSTGQKATGWEEGDQPNSKWFNWLFRTTMRWLAYLRDFELNAHIWTALNTFRGAAADEDPAVSVDVDHGSGGTRKLVFQFGAPGSRKIRFYRAANNDLEITFNACWHTIAASPVDAYHWAADDKTWDSYKVNLGEAGQRLLHRLANSAVQWDESTGWDEAISALFAGQILFDKILAGDNGGYPGPTSTVKNTMLPSGLLKARATVFYNHAQDKYYLLDGMNIAGPTVAGVIRTGAQGFMLSFAQAMADANYQVMITDDSGLFTTAGGGDSWRATTDIENWTKTTSGVGIGYRKVNGAAMQPTRDHTLSILVFGKQ